MQALILAAGRGRRLKPRFSKPLLYLPGGTLLEYQLSMVADLPFSSIFVVYSAPEVERLLRGWEGVYAIRQREPFTLMGALLAAEKEVNERFLVLHGDNYFSQGLSYFLREAEGHKYAFLTEGKEEGGKEAQWLATTGAYILSPEVFYTLRLLRSKDRLISLTEALLSREEGLYEVDLRGWRRNINTWDGLLKTNHRLLREWRSAFHPPNVEEGYDGERLIWVSPRASVTNSNLGPYVTVGTSTRIEGCTLEEVVVFPHAQAEGLRLKRGFILPSGLAFSVEGEGEG